MVSSFLPSPPKEETKQRRKGAARSLRPKICPPSADGMKLARCARSDSHSVRALRAVKSSKWASRMLKYQLMRERTHITT